MMTMKPALPVVVGMGGGVATVMMRQRRMVMVMGGHMMMRRGHVVMHRDADVTMRHRWTVAKHLASGRSASSG